MSMSVEDGLCKLAHQPSPYLVTPVNIKGDVNSTVSFRQDHGLRRVCSQGDCPAETVADSGTFQTFLLGAEFFNGSNSVKAMCHACCIAEVLSGSSLELHD